MVTVTPLLLISSPAPFRLGTVCLLFSLERTQENSKYQAGFLSTPRGDTPGTIKASPEAPNQENEHDGSLVHQEEISMA